MSEGVVGPREEGAVLKEKNKRRCEGIFSAGVSDGRLHSRTGLCLLLFVPCNCVPATVWVRSFHANAHEFVYNWATQSVYMCACYLLDCDIQLFCCKSTHIPPSPQQPHCMSVC